MKTRTGEEMLALTLGLPRLMTTCGWATHWQVSDDGLTWYFHLRPELIFTDGRPVTGHDYVGTFRIWADPKTGYDFEWYYHAIKNWQAVVSGKIPVQDLCIRTIDDHTLAISTEQRRARSGRSTRPAADPPPCSRQD
jgi:ABC-type oligopeptide transport system substrate-binding subunit